MALNTKEHLQIFLREFPQIGTPRVFRAPARINIIGEHVDYLGGIVLPAAIDFYLEVIVSPNSEDSYNLYSVAFQQKCQIPANRQSLLPQSSAPWADYILGVVSELGKKGIEVPGFSLSLSGNIPQGAGLSSSAALEVAVGFALNSIFKLGLSKTELALLGQAAENNFVGTNCGIMDQFVIAHGKKDNCLSLDTHSLQYQYHQFDLKEYAFYLINSNVKHSLKDSGYNDRRKECESALAKIQALDPECKDLYSFKEPIENWKRFGFTPGEQKRTKHVVTEKIRTQKMIESLSSGNLEAVGNILNEAHWSLSRNFEVSCNEIDFLVQKLADLKVPGGRMIGGGFGGCVLFLDKKANFQKTKERLEKSFPSGQTIPISFYEFSISDGVHEITV